MSVVAIEREVYNFVVGQCAAGNNIEYWPVKSGGSAISNLGRRLDTSSINSRYLESLPTETPTVFEQVTIVLLNYAGKKATATGDVHC